MAPSARSCSSGPTPSPPASSTNRTPGDEALRVGLKCEPDTAAVVASEVGVASPPTIGTSRSPAALKGNCNAQSKFPVARTIPAIPCVVTPTKVCASAACDRTLASASHVLLQAQGQESGASAASMRARDRLYARDIYLQLPHASHSPRELPAHSSVMAGGKAGKPL